MNNSPVNLRRKGTIAATLLAAAVFTWLIAVPAHASCGDASGLPYFVGMIGLLIRRREEGERRRFPRGTFSKIMRILYAMLAVLMVAVFAITSMWYVGFQAEREVARAVVQGDEKLASYIERISKAAWFITATFGEEAQSTAFQEVCATGNEPSTDVKYDYTEYLRTVLRTYPYVREYIFTYTASGRTYTLSLGPQSEISEEMFPTKTAAFRTRELVASLLRGNEISMERIETYRDGSLVIPYTMAFRTEEGVVAGSMTTLIALQEFFRDFEDAPPKNLFVVDSEGHYLWHTNTEKRGELAAGKDSSFFSDYPEAYPDILAGRGERRVKDGNRYIQVRPIYVAFEVVVNCVSRKLNTQHVSPQHYVWFIGYEE